MKIISYILHIILLIFSSYFSYSVHMQKKELKSLNNKQKLQKMIAESASPAKIFLAELEKTSNILETVRARSKINNYDVKEQLYEESKEDKKKYFYVESSYILDTEYLDFISILEELKKQELIYNIKELILENKETSTTISVNLITLAYEKI